MIKLSTNFTTTNVSTMGGQSQTVTTDTLLVSRVSIDFQANQIQATLQRGTVTDGVFTANMTPVNINVSSTGAFRSADGSWSGTLNVASLLSSLASDFDQSVVAGIPALGTVAA
jgi:hypothetical protein